MVLASMVLAACGQITAPATPLPTPAPRPTLTRVPTRAIPSPTVPASATAPSTPLATATEDSLFPPVTEADWQMGPVTATVTIVEYGDFQ